MPDLLLGTPVARVEDRQLLTGGARYIANLDLPGAAAVAYVTSTVAHGRVVAIDVEPARRAPGVLGVFTADDLDGLGPASGAAPGYPEAMVRPLLAGDTVRFVGEPVAVVVAETAAEAEDAADLVVVDIDPLPALVDAEAALVEGAPLLFPEAGTNRVEGADGGTAAVAPEDCEVVVRGTLHSARIAPCPLEPRAAASRWEPDGRLTHWVSSQGSHPIRATLCQLHDLAPERVRVITPDVGGSFGSKARAYPEDLLLPWLAARVGRPVRWLPTRSQDMVGLGHSRVQVQTYELGGRRDGTIESLRVHVLADVGAYPVAGAMLARNAGQLSPGAYTIASARWTTTAVVTNTTPIAAYRGAGRPEAANIIERAVDEFARELGLDPAEVRRRNLIPPDAFPWQSATGLTYDSGRYQLGLDAALTAAGYDELRAEQARRRAAGDPVELGIGLATFVDRTAGVAGTEYGSVELRPDGSLLVRTGSTPYGQGHDTAWAMLVSDRTGVPMDRIEVVHGDTDLVPRSGITGGSRSAQRAGAAVAVASEALVERAIEQAARVFEASVDDVVLDTAGGGRFHVVGTPGRSIGWSDVAAAGVDDDPEGALRCEHDAGGDSSYPFGAYVAVVDVDTETGHVALRRLITVDDAGTVLNPLLAEGQVHGGAAQGVGQALYEEFVYDPDGNPLTATLAEYAFPTAVEIPWFEGTLLETPTPNNVLGAKGIAESGTIGVPPAVQNAVVDALATRGVRHVDLPCTPQRVWRALQRVGAPA